MFRRYKLQTIYLDLWNDLILPFFCIVIFFPPSYRPPTSVSIHRCIPLFVCTCSPLLLLAQSAAHHDVAFTHHPTSSAACLCTSCRVPASSTVSPDCAPPLPHCQHRYVPGSLSDPEGIAHHGSLCLPYAPASPSFIFPPNPHMSLFLVSCQVAIGARARGQVTSILWKLLALVFALPMTWL